MLVQNKKTLRKYSITNNDWDKIVLQKKKNMFNVLDKSYKVDIVDFACGEGGSLGWARTVFGWDTLFGVDNYDGTLEKAFGYGYSRKSFLCADLLTLDVTKIPKSRYVIMTHFLEHLKNDDECEVVIRKALQVADEFIFIKHPFFDGDEYLESIGFKFTWSDWPGTHDNKVTKKRLDAVLDKIGVEYVSGYVNPVIDSSDDKILPFDCPSGQPIYNEQICGKKEIVKFENVFRETYAFININCKNFSELIKTDVK